MFQLTELLYFDSIYLQRLFQLTGLAQIIQLVLGIFYSTEVLVLGFILL